MWPSAEQGRNECPHAEQEVMKGRRLVQARGWITSTDYEGLPSLHCPACPSPRLRTGVPGDRMCAGGTATANSDPREDVRSGQLQHDVKKYIRGHDSGDVVGLELSQHRDGCVKIR